MTHPGATRLTAAHLALAAVLVALSVGLAGCITLFPKATPVQLYRFDAAIQPVQGSGRGFAVRTGFTEFDPQSSGDRILTVNGDQVAYIAEGRWAIPASQLFDEAVAHGFDAPGDAARLVAPGQAAKAEYRLRLQVIHFEARYLSGPTAAPTIVVTVRATLDRQSDLTMVGTQEFEAQVPASDNRIAPMVAAYDAATTKVVGDLVAWVDAKGG
jgi:cholesterol transport system auxiliary component